MAELDTITVERRRSRAIRRPPHLTITIEIIMSESKTIGEMTVRERQELLAAVADTLDQSAKEALEKGYAGFAADSHSLALIIRGSSGDLSRRDLTAAELLLQQGIAMIEQFRMRKGRSRRTTLH